MGIWDRALFTGAKHAAPMYRNYIDILAGHQGKLKSMLGWGATIEGGLYAADSLYRQLILKKLLLAKINKK